MSCVLFLSKSLLLFCFLVLFLTVAANCHLWAYFIWACFVFVSRSLSHHLYLSLTLFLSSARLHLPKSGWAKRGSSCDCDFRLMQFIIMATAAETFAEAKPATSAATAIELPFGYECRPPQCRCWCRGNLSNSKKTQRKKQNKIEEKTKK